MEHVRGFAAAIDKVSRVLKAEVRFYVVVPNASSFKDTPYRGSYMGDGHPQCHSFESVLAMVYGRSPLKLLSYVECPVGFTFLVDRQGLWTLVALAVMACRESPGIGIRRLFRPARATWVKNKMRLPCSRCACATA